LHVTHRSDLRNPRPAARGSWSGPTTIRVLEGAPKRWYRLAQAAWSKGKLAEAAHAFVLESGWYEGAGLGILAGHALDDATRTNESDPAVGMARQRLERLASTTRAGNG
jgi:hypothetical protein